MQEMAGTVLTMSSDKCLTSSLDETRDLRSARSPISLHKLKVSEDPSCFKFVNNFLTRLLGAPGPPDGGFRYTCPSTTFVRRGVRGRIRRGTGGGSGWGAGDGAG